MSFVSTEFRNASAPRAADGDFAHVRDVENAGGVAHGEMLVGDAGVLHGHLPAAEINQLRAEFLVRGKKCGAFEHEGQPHFSRLHLLLRHSQAVDDKFLGEINERVRAAGIEHGVRQIRRDLLDPFRRDAAGCARSSCPPASRACR